MSMNNTASELTLPPDVSGSNRGKLFAALFSLAMIGAVFWPIQQNWRAKPQDNFPLSYYPMFSNKREAVENFFYLVGLDAQGVRHQIPYRYIGEGGGNSVRRQLRKIIGEGRGPELAKTVAKRLAKKNTSPWSEIVSVTVCTGKYDVDAFFHGKKETVSENVKGSAQVKRKAQ